MAAPRFVRQASRPAASSISRAMTCGWEISDRWLAFTSMMDCQVKPGNDEVKSMQTENTLKEIQWPAC